MFSIRVSVGFVLDMGRRTWYSHCARYRRNVDDNIWTSTWYSQIWQKFLLLSTEKPYGTFCSRSAAPPTLSASYVPPMTECMAESWQQGAVRNLWNNNMHQTRMLSSILAIQHLFFAMMLLVAFKDCDLGVPIQIRTNGSVFPLQRLQAQTKTFSALIHNLLYADDLVVVTVNVCSLWI